MDSYTTSDFYLSAFLLASGTPLLDFERKNGRTSFRFAETDELSELIEHYFADQVRVSPIRYGNSLKNLKALIYSGNTNMNANGKSHITHNTGATK